MINLLHFSMDYPTLNRTSGELINLLILLAKIVFFFNVSVTGQIFSVNILLFLIKKY